MKVMIAGATSAIAGAVARKFAGEGNELFLVARNADRLDAVSDHLAVCGARRIEKHLADLNCIESHRDIVAAAVEKLGGLDLVLIAHGVLGDQKLSEADSKELAKGLTANFVSAASLSMVAAKHFERQASGCLAVITSVAGDRGRRSNYAYGAAKGGMSIFLQGLRDRLKASGVSVVDLKLGFVDTPMTASVPKNPLFVDADRAAAGIFRAIQKKRGVAYVPWFWRPIMLAVRAIPGPIFRRLPL